MKVRLTASGVPGFRHEGLAVGTGWSEFDWGAADEKTRAAVVKYHGTFFRTHPDDEKLWAGAGLQLVAGRLEKPKPAVAAPAVEPTAESESSGRPPRAARPR